MSSYRMRATVRRRWTGYLAIVLLLALLGGIAVGAIAGARRTQSSFSKFLASTNPSDMTVVVFPRQPSPFTPITRMAQGLPGVRRVGIALQPLGLPLAANGIPRVGTLADLTVISSLNGEYFNQDRVAVIKGRMANPGRTDEFVTTAEGAALYGWRVGERIPFGFYDAAGIASPRFPTGGVEPIVRVDATLVGIVVFNNGVVQDDVDRLPTFALFTPALTRAVLARSSTAASAAFYDFQLTGGSRAVPAAERAFNAALPSGDNAQFAVTSLVAAKANRAIKPESIALGVFGLIAGLATLAIAGQALARQLRANSEDLEVLRALGADPATTMSDGLLGVLAAVVVGSLLAVGVAVALSPLSPIGPVRAVYPTPGVAVDWTVLGLGLACLIVGLGTIAVALSYRWAPHRVAERRGLASQRGSVLVRSAAQAGLPAPAVAGVRFALEPGRGRTAVPVRSALFGTVLAVVVVVATVTFGSGLRTLVSHPSLYGWNWTYGLVSEDAPDVPPQATALLSRDPDVAAWSGATIISIQIDGQTVPTIVQASHAAVAPPILSGHALDSSDEIVLGAATMDELHEHVGGTVIGSYGSPKSYPAYVPPTVLHIVGTATMPAIGFATADGDHPSMGTGALVATGVEPVALQRLLRSPFPTLNGPEFVFVRMRTGVSNSAALADMNRIAGVAAKAFAAVPDGQGTGGTITVLSVLRPAEIADYRSTGATPLLLAAGLAAGAVAALGLTLAASVRRRRRDLALLKALGFTQAQLSMSVAVQATVVGIVGIVFGVPLGIAFGRWLWVLFAREIFAVPEPTVPVLEIVLIAVVSLVLVNIVAALPGRSAARTPTALVLRAE
ncbi:MAG: FtsX-like permease family protein [Acidimicrobiales bacterium]